METTLNKEALIENVSMIQKYYDSIVSEFEENADDDEYSEFCFNDFERELTILSELINKLK
jgi:ribosomal protein S17E